MHGEGAASLRDTLSREWIDSLVVVGGDGTLQAALRLAEEGISLVGVPKTIDNDIAGTDVTFGFDTAVQIATDALDRITTTAESHDRIMLVEVMGRTRGWIATYAGIAAGADAVLVPEEPHDLGQWPHSCAPCGGRPALLGGGGRRGRPTPARHRGRGRWTSSASSSWAASRR